jgi:hypothetical protein
MRSIALSLRLLLGICALSGGALVACGEDAPAKEKDTDEADDGDDGTDGEKDAGKGGKDAGKDAGKPKNDEQDEEDEEPECTGKETQECDDCDEDECIQTCSGGEFGECKPKPASSGPIDAGVSVTKSDGGNVTVTFNDASITVMTMACGAPLTCQTAASAMGVGALVAMGIGSSYCGDSTGLPPACTGPADCTKAGLTSSACTALGPLGMFCVQLCK